MRFAVPLTLFGRVKKEEQGVDIKKGATFAVHGIRALAPNMAFAKQYL